MVRHEKNDRQPQDTGKKRYGDGHQHNQGPFPVVLSGYVGIREAENEIGDEIADAAAGNGDFE